MNKPSRFLLIDLECTCNDDPPLPKGESEIIEIGAILGQLRVEGFSLIDELQLYVRPTIHPTLTPFCTTLTGIEQQTVNCAPELETSFRLLTDFLREYSPTAWGSWGKFDARQFETEAVSKSIPNPIALLPHHNIKQLFARKRGHRVGLARAVQLSGLHFQGQHHSGLDDARNIGRLIEHDDLLREAILKRL
ncbi:MAG: 3'-5' exonuclease [Thalassobium sp.]|nr:MAG: 3'-5' exonuclease [Thalassobium sp.]